MENLRYLNSQQAIADVANFIDTKNREYNLTTTDAKWVAFGGSYAGNLVAWLRLKYPHLVHIAIASSGPVLAKLDYFGIIIIFIIIFIIKIGVNFFPLFKTRWKQT